MRRNRYYLNEAVNPLDKIQALIDQANSAYAQAIEHQGETEWPLMDKDGEVYGLSGSIRLDKRGFIIIPINGSPHSSYGPVKIKVFTQAGGKIRILPGDYWGEGWKDARKILNNIIRDAKIGNSHFSEYDPSWEDEGNKAALRDMNKRIGRRSNAGMDYLEDVVRESVRRTLNNRQSLTEGREAINAYKTVGKFLVNLDEKQALHIAAEILLLINRGTAGKNLDEVVEDVCQKFSYALHGNNQ